MADKKIPTPEELRKLLDYDPATGLLTWRERPVTMFQDKARSARHSCNAWNAHYAGKPAFTAPNAHGYLTGGVHYRVYLAHRVAWAISTGAWPEHEIDHINGDRADNRLVNLREVDDRDNACNAKRRSDNKSGVTGVCYNKPARKWQVNVGVRGENRYLGRYDTLEEAIEVRRKAERGAEFHENHGRAI